MQACTGCNPTPGCAALNTSSRTGTALLPYSTPPTSYSYQLLRNALCCMTECCVMAVRSEYEVVGAERGPVPAGGGRRRVVSRSEPADPD